MVGADDVRVVAFAKRMASGAFDADSRFLKTSAALVRRPGLLTAEYMAGRRRPYLHPLQAFLLANLVFFAVLGTVGGMNTFTTQLRYHVQQPVYGPVAERLVARHAAPGSPEAVEYAERFDKATPRYANSMIILIVPIFAVILAVLFVGRGTYFVRHLVFALHFIAFVLLFSAALPLVLSPVLLSIPDLQRLANHELAAVPIIVLPLGLYLTLAIRRAYAIRAAPAVARAAAAMLLLLPALTVYRAVLFFVIYLRVD